MNAASSPSDSAPKYCRNKPRADSGFLAFALLVFNVYFLFFIKENNQYDESGDAQFNLSIPAFQRTPSRLPVFIPR